MGHGTLIFLDLTMPEMDGYGVLETLRQEGCAAKVIVVSGDIFSRKPIYARHGALGALKLSSRSRPPRKPCLLPCSSGMACGSRRYRTPSPSPSPLPDKSPVDAPPCSPRAAGCSSGVANVAIAEAALLARLLGAFVQLPIPNVNVLEVSEAAHGALGGRRSRTPSAVCQDFIGAGIAGEASLLFHDASFRDTWRG